MGYVFGEVNATIKRDATVLYGPDDFSRGPCGWTIINNSTTFTAPMLPAANPSISERGALQISTEDGTVNSGVPWNYAMAIKRQPYPHQASTVRMDMYLALATGRSGSGTWVSPRAVNVGLDTGWGSNADGTPNRTFYALRFLMFDEAAGNSLRFQLATGGLGNLSAQTYTDAPLSNGSGQVIYKLGYNEDKHDPFHLQLELDLANKRYLGMAINGIGYGSMAATPDQSFYNVGQASSDALTSGSFATFYGGSNTCVEIYNRTSTALSKTKGWIMEPQMLVLS